LFFENGALRKGDGKLRAGNILEKVCMQGIRKWQLCKMLETCFSKEDAIK
jgi:hypothetical protein